MTDWTKIIIAALVGFVAGFTACGGAVMLYLSLTTGQGSYVGSVGVRHPGGVLCEATGVRVLDADTVECDLIRYPSNLALVHQVVRASNYDAAEASDHPRSTGPKVTAAEIKIGKQAAKEFRELLTNGVLYIEPGSKDRDDFGRLLAKLYVLQLGTKIEMGQYMREKGYLRPVQ